jgi:glycosyltransferase involved in cell wall biosynthesis
MVGAQAQPITPHDGLVLPGFVDDLTLAGIIAGATVLVVPSYYESLSLALIEGWNAAVPAMTQRACAVTTGQAQRSGGGVPYSGYVEFEAALDVLLESLSLRRSLGEAGRAYVAAKYSWASVLDRYERLLERVIRGRPRPPVAVWRK